MVGKIVLYFVFSVFVFMGVTSFTKTMMPTDASNLTGAFFAIIAFAGVLIVGWITGRNKGEPKEKKGKK